MDGHRCSKLAIRYYQQATLKLPRVNWYQAKAELLQERDMRGEKVAKTREQLIVMIRCADPNLAYDCAMTLLGSFMFTPVSKPAVAAVKEVIERYERELAKLREELTLDRTPP
jgi:hypothetical protein